MGDSPAPMIARPAPTSDGLLPRRLRPVGYLLTLLGGGLAVLRFHYGVKPDFLDLPVFAIRSVYLETRSFTVIRNNLAEEVAGLFLLVGLVLIAFSRETTEDATVAARRLRALIVSCYLSAIVIALGLLFFFGLAFGAVLLAAPFLQLCCYLALFHGSRLRQHLAISRSPDADHATRR